MKRARYFVGLVSLFPLLSQAEVQEQDFFELSFDELTQVEVTSVSKKSEKLSEAAAAVYVVTADDIRRSGATSIPEALRLVPGVDVAQIDPNKWAVSIRGFNGRFANKLLVLIDGRSVYTPTHSGVYWEYLDYLMTDIERIEVIRGPGATLWGANAVNGVINIITREADETPGGSLSVIAGNEHQGFGVRQGGALSENTQMRAYVKGKHLDESVNSTGDGQDNGGDYLQTGFRLDAQPNDKQWWTLQGDLYRDYLGEEHNVPNLDTDGITDLTKIVNEDVDTKGGNLSSHWGMLTGWDSELTTRLSFDFYDHDDFKYSEDRQTVNLELQHGFSPLKDHDLVWGGGYRWSKNKMDYSALVYGGSDTAYSNIWNLFIQDTLSFPDYNINLILGAKLEGYSYVDTELQPNVRISWLPNEQLTWWASISRAMRTPSQWEREITIDYDLYYNNEVGPLLIDVVGNNDFESEQLDAYELGFRWSPMPELSIDIATFYNRYKNLLSYDTSSFTPDYPYSVIDLDLSNNVQGYSTGLELLTTWQATPHSRFRFVYSLLEVNLEDTKSNDFSVTLLSMMADRSPKHQVSLWSSYDLSESVETDFRLYYTSQRNWETDVSNPIIDATIDADLRIGWQATKSLTLSIVGRNLLHANSQQFQAEGWPSASYLERSIFIKGVLSW